MPRARQQPQPPGYGPAQVNGQAGATQAPVAPTGMPYGEHQASIESQAQMPLPDAQAQMAAALQAAQATMPPEPIMGAPSQRPDLRPLAGVNQVPTPVPRQTNAIASFYRAIAEVWGDDEMARLAEDAERKGL